MVDSNVSVALKTVSLARGAFLYDTHLSLSPPISPSKSGVVFFSDTDGLPDLPALKTDCATDKLKLIDVESTTSGSPRKGRWSAKHNTRKKGTAVDIPRGGELDSTDHSIETDSLPSPVFHVPERFVRAGKGDPVEGLKRYTETSEWRKQERMDQILTEPQPHFHLIKSQWPHFFHGRGYGGEVVYYETPAKMNLKVLKEGGVNLDILLRHYAFVTEFSWQHIDTSETARSTYVIDLQGIKLMDFAGEVIDFVKKASKFTGQHYPEKAGYVMVINVPAWFKLIWKVVKPMVDEATLKKIYILRGKKEILKALQERIPPEYIPSEYGGQGLNLGDAEEEQRLFDLVEHNNKLHEHVGHSSACNGKHGVPPCQFCSFEPVPLGGNQWQQFSRD
uniref:CRAL-TRIO domain-containing protein n=1 Tax=Attheya septentrionalis TaxID=420275 RepID=A0A7S2U9B8_9STRA|mmetsp:Transcript_15998/g.29093  ORF Transcript_15998/g.29093 Transcript_15998/m.29093 type:complete len:391 (+) Transcript_15998:153-1325(+)